MLSMSLAFDLGSEVGQLWPRSRLVAVIHRLHLVFAELSWFSVQSLFPLQSHLVPRHTLPVELAGLERGSTELAISQLPGSVFKTKLQMKGIQSAPEWT